MVLQVPVIVSNVADVMVRCTGLLQGEDKLAPTLVTDISVPFIIHCHSCCQKLRHWKL